jgi:hypothetical protein
MRSENEILIDKNSKLSADFRDVRDNQRREREEHSRQMAEKERQINELIRMKQEESLRHSERVDAM